MAIRRNTIGGSMDDLMDRVRRLERIVQNERDENARLRTRIERRDKRIDELLKEKFGLQDELERVCSQGIGEQRNGVSNEEAANDLEYAQVEPSTERSKARIPGESFKPNPLYKTTERHDGAISARIDAVAAQDLDWTRKPSGLMPQSLGEVEWVVTDVSEQERTAWKVEGEKLADFETAEEDHDEDRPAKRRRHDSKDSRRDSVTLGRGSVDTEKHGTTANALHHHRPSLPVPPPPLSTREPVCVHCWQHGRTCNLGPRCLSCVRDRVRCVWKLCEAGRACCIKRCPCLHPGEWDETDRRFVVEEGRQPRKR